MRLNYYLVLVIMVIAGCSYQKTTYLHVVGQNVKYPMGFSSIQGNVEMTLNREVRINCE